MNLTSFLSRREHVFHRRFQSLGFFGGQPRLTSILGAASMALLVLPTRAELMPSSRLVDWTPGVSVGVPGGIPTNRTKLIDVTMSPYRADNTGATDATAAIQAAITAAVAGDVIYLPAGTYRVSGVHISGAKDNITIRGAGNSTIIEARGNNTVFSAGPGSDYAWAQQPYAHPSSGNTITAGLTKGSTVLTIQDTSAFSAGQIIQVAIENQTNPTALMAGAVPTVSVAGYGTLRRQLSRVVSKTSTTLTIFPAIHFTPDSGLVSKVNGLQDQLDGFGLESLYVDCSKGTVGLPISFGQCYGSWIKDVTIYKTSNYGFSIANSLNCEIRQSSALERAGAGSNGAGILLNHVGNSLIEDNISYMIGPPVEVNDSSTGNVVAYNFLYCPGGGNLNVNHGPHNSFNLYEGNITPNMQADGYFGSASDDTFFRNWITGALRETNTYTFIISLNRFSRNYSFVGNILGSSGWPYGSSPYSFGNPNMGNSAFSGTAQPSAGKFWSDWNMTAILSTRTSDASGVLTLSSGSLTTWQYVSARWGANSVAQFYPSSVSGNTVTFTASSAVLPPVGSVLAVYTGSGGYQEADLDVKNTTFLKANYHAWSDGGMGIPSDQAIGSATLPSSMYRSTKPAWFGDRPWPAFDPFNPIPAYDSIPAGYRYLNNNFTPPPAVAAAPTNVRVRRL